jgi:tetraacyldisaccharide-1-P 4'-kinase
MLNGLTPWGNGHLIPRGPMREPLTALTRADILVIHHANLVCHALNDSDLCVASLCFQPRIKYLVSDIILDMRH